MRKRLPYVLSAVLLLALPAWTQQTTQSTLGEELRAELATLKAQIARTEALLERLEKDPTAIEALQQTEKRPPESPPAKQAPALNTPPMLPPSSAEAFRKTPPRFDVLIQARGDYFADAAKNDTFFLRKAELGVKGHISENVDYSLELDPVRPNDPFRRTYIRLTHLDRLHVKLGLEKAPIGLEELTATAQIAFVDRSEVNDRFAAAEELGVHLESHWDHWLFQLAVTNGGRRLMRDDNKQKDVTARVVWAPRHWISLGTAVLEGQAGNDERARDRYNAEFKLGSNLTGFQTEFYRAKDTSIWTSAYYVAGFWAFPTHKRWLTHFQPVIRYEQIDSGDGDREKELGLLTFGFGLLFDEHRSKFSANYLKDLRTGARQDEFRAQYQVEF